MNIVELPARTIPPDLIARFAAIVGDRYAVTDPATSQIYALKHVVRKDEKSERFVSQLENEYAVGSKTHH